MTAVLDASAFLAFLWDEPGAQRVSEVVGGHMSCVNVAEVRRKALGRGVPAQGLDEAFTASGLVLHPFAETDARLTAELALRNAQSGLSLGDWACLALAHRLDLPAVTADKQWRLVRGAKVDLIR